MSVLSTGQFYGETKTRREAAGIAVSRLDHHTGRKLPMHVHRQAYFSMILDGGYREETGSQSIDYEPLTIVYHPPGTAHIDEIGPRGAKFLMIEADDRLVTGEGLSPRVRAGYPSRLPPRARWMALQLLRDGGDPLLRESITLDLLGAIEGPDDSRSTPGWLRDVLDRIQDDFVSPPSTSELARDAGVHPVHLARVVRSATGRTVAELVRQRRVEAAFDLLGAEDSLASIANRTGFSDQAHFTRSFRSVTRFTPAALRRLL